MKAIFCVILVTSTLLSGQSIAQAGNGGGKPYDIWENPNRGFNWYPDPAEKAPAEPARPLTKQEQLDGTPLEEIAEMDDLRTKLNRMKDKAVMSGEPKEVYEWMKAQQFVLAKASKFSNTAQAVNWQNPEIDPTTTTPVANNALVSADLRKNAADDAKISALGKRYGIFFFYRSDCGFCHDMAPALAEYAMSTGMRVQPVSLDGGEMPPFRNAIKDNGISRLVSKGRGIKYTPTLYLVDNEQKETILLGAGAMSTEEVTKRILFLHDKNNFAVSKK